MRLPVVEGIIARRLLINYRVDPSALDGVLPAPFRPKLVSGYAMAGICLIRLADIRPRGLPAAMGLDSENAAHRIAVEWGDGAEKREGVYIPRRDSNSRVNTLLGGRVFSGWHHYADFSVDESAERFSVALRSADGATRVAVDARLSTTLPPDSVFATVEQASAFFEAGSLGYSAGRHAGEYDGLELRSRGWRVEPLSVEHVASSFFEDPDRFPPGSATFDSALVMRGIPHEWRAQPSLRRAPAA